MKPTALRPGHRVMIKPVSGQNMLHGSFVKRIPRVLGKPAYSVIRIDDFAGLGGPGDLGETHYSDYDVSRRVQLEGECN